MEVKNSPRSKDKRPDIVFIDDLDCEHKHTEKRFVGYHFTEELFALFCKECGKRLTEPKT